MSFDGFEDAEVRMGPPESWEEFCDRMQRQCGKGSRVFKCNQLGVDGAPQPFVMILVPGPFREDLA